MALLDLQGLEAPSHGGHGHGHGHGHSGLSLLLCR